MAKRKHIYKKDEIKPYRWVCSEEDTPCPVTGRGEAWVTSYPNQVTCPTCKSYWKGLNADDKADYIAERRRVWDEQDRQNEIKRALDRGEVDYLGWKVQVVDYDVVAHKNGSEIRECHEYLILKTFERVKARVQLAEFERLQGQSLEKFLQEKLES